MPLNGVVVAAEEFGWSKSDKMLVGLAFTSLLQETSPFMPLFMSGLAGHKEKRKKLYVDKKLNRLAVPPIPLF